jgi:opacity protein-like surface antigen
MKLRYLATVVLLALTTVAAHAQSQEAPTQGNVGIYLNPIFIRVSNSVKETSPFALLGQNSTSKVFYGYNLGGFYDFLHAGKLTTGFDVRFSDLHANNGMIRNFLVGVRVSGQPFKRPLKPYVQLSGGLGTSKAPDSTVHIRKGEYGVFAGADYTLGRHVDWRVAEIGYGSLTTVSSATVGAGGNVAIPASKLLSFSGGFVFRF